MSVETFSLSAKVINICLASYARCMFFAIDYDKNPLAKILSSCCCEFSRGKLFSYLY
jgi:hypothetical protein